MGALLRAFWGIIPATAIALPYAALCWPLLVVRRRRRSGVSVAHASATAGVDLLIVTLAGLILLLVTMPVGAAGGSAVHLVPGTDLTEAFSDDGSLWQVIGNLFLLGPLGALVPLRAPRLRSAGRIALVALIASLLVEAAQFVLHNGRVTSTDDVLLNTLGATLGAALTRPGWRRFDLPVPPIPQQTRRTICVAPLRLHDATPAEPGTRYVRLSHPERR
ncbi:VanZ family protein [Amycolatopsis jiangsuensis]|uniref:Glycopeptide antibiotics resistance protein n=1 Tax=Amycolatopsis jiangsuensis TaxID=1181879 RepID=A0A840J1N4_9PSEU|nr:VanZ family protein [Amycolatopsis jiangsuensis]MBB4687555.1 glycopeptide antibiotics resistance protein [Amycolatopsis jiangsuensis]